MILNVASVKVLIVEDELLIAELIKMYLEERQHECVGIAISFDEAIVEVREKQPDIVLIDIRLYGEKSGINLAEYLVENHPGIPLVFLTSQFDKRIVSSAVKTKPAGYLTKPIQKQSLWTTIETSFMTLLDQEENQSTISIKDGEFTHILEEDSILRVEADHIYIKIYLEDKKPIVARKSLAQFLELVRSNSFVQCHRSHIINAKKVASFNGNTLKIREHDIPISRSRKAEVISMLNS